MHTVLKTERPKPNSQNNRSSKSIQQRIELYGNLTFLSFQVVKNSNGGIIIKQLETRLFKNVFKLLFLKELMQERLANCPLVTLETFI